MPRATSADPPEDAVPSHLGTRGEKGTSTAEGRRARLGCGGAHGGQTPSHEPASYQGGWGRPLPPMKVSLMVISSWVLSKRLPNISSQMNRLYCAHTSMPRAGGAHQASVRGVRQGVWCVNSSRSFLVSYGGDYFAWMLYMHKLKDYGQIGIESNQTRPLSS